MINIKFSIIISTFNRVDKLDSLMTSLSKQSFNNFEIIIIEAGETDVYRKLVEKFSNYPHNNLKILHHENSSLGASRNFGVGNCSGNYVLFSDDDDVWEPNKIEIIYNELQKDYAPFLYHQFNISKNGKIMNGWARSIGSLPFDIISNFISNKISGGSAFGGEKKSLLAIKFDETLRSCEDTEWWVRVLLSGAKLRFIDKSLVTYIYHDNQMTKNFSRLNNGEFQVAKKYFLLSLALFIGSIFKIIRIVIRNILKK